MVSSYYSYICIWIYNPSIATHLMLLDVKFLETYFNQLQDKYDCVKTQEKLFHTCVSRPLNEEHRTVKNTFFARIWLVNRDAFLDTYNHNFTPSGILIVEENLTNESLLAKNYRRNSRKESFSEDNSSDDTKENVRNLKRL